MRTSVQSKFSDDEDKEVDWSLSPTHKSFNSSSFVNEPQDEDDIPLAQRIPSALQAQKSIRTQEKSYKRSRVRSQDETKQPTAPEFTELLVNKLDKLRDENTQQLPSATRTKHVQSVSPGVHPPPAPPSGSRPRNKSFSQQSRPNIDIITSSNKGLLSRSLTQSVSRCSPKAIPPFTEPSSIRSTTSPSQVQVPSVRTRSKSFNISSSKMSDYPVRSNDQPPPLPNFYSTRTMQLQTPLQGHVSQHRVFIESMQRFNTVGIQTHTSAYDIIVRIANQGELGGDASNVPKDWMLWEVAQDFGLERPIRHYERPSDIYASWNANTRLNTFMLKKTPLSSILAPDKIPNSSPTCGGYVQWESKRGKWNKRWMELKEHSIWLSKRNTGKDRTFLCSISSFDCYFMSRQYKAPKPFVFALKSTDNLTMFENPADYLHIFSCDQNEGPRWTQAILLARSYVLHKERTVLFTSPQSPVVPTTTFSHPGQKPLNSNKPLLDLKANSGGFNNKELFHSGSLLARS